MKFPIEIQRVHSTSGIFIGYFTAHSWDFLVKALANVKVCIKSLNSSLICQEIDVKFPAMSVRFLSTDVGDIS